MTTAAAAEEAGDTSASESRLQQFIMPMISAREDQGIDYMGFAVQKPSLSLSLRNTSGQEGSQDPSAFRFSSVLLLLIVEFGFLPQP